MQNLLVQTAAIDVETSAPGAAPQDALGGADRTSWTALVPAVPCLVRPLSASQQVRNEARGEFVDTRIYFAGDPVNGGLSTRHRIRVGGATYHVKGAVDANSMGRLLHVDCELLRFP